MDHSFRSLVPFFKSWNKIRSSFVLMVALMFLFNCPANSQVLRDSLRVKQVKEFMSDIYNLRFSEAEGISNQIGAAFPDSPVPPLLRGMTIYWKNYPLLPTSPERATYENFLRQSINISEKSRPDKEDEAEYLLADLCARGLLLVFYSDNDQSSDVIRLASGTYHLVRESFNYTSVYSDFCFFTGLYLYYREKYPDIHPVYKPFALLFPAGDISKGLSDMQKAFGESIFLSAEAGSFLSWIYSGYEKDYIKALLFSRQLYERYPGNASYLSSYIKYLLLARQYDEAENLITSPGNEINNSFFRAQITVLKGIVEEKKHLDLRSAERFYREGLTLLQPYGDFANEYAAYACYGLSRVYAADKTGEQKRKFRKQGNKLAEFRHMNFDK